MADETKETAVTDDALSEAQDKATEVSEELSQNSEEAVSETQEAEETVDDEHKERSGLGRRVSKMENSINSFMEEMRTTMSNQPPQSAEVEQYNSDEKYISTEQDLENWYQKRTSRENVQKQKYDTDYLGAFDKLADEENLDDDTFNEVSKLLTKTFNKSESNFKNPVLDAKLNFINAMRAVEKSKGKTSSLNGGTPKGGLVGQTKGSVKNVKTPDLDEHAKSFVNHLKREGSELSKDENLSKVFTGETSRGLKKNESIQR